MQLRPRLGIETADRVFVTDFDGTLAAVDFYDLFMTHYYPATSPDYWSMCLAGKLTQFEALRNVYAEVAVAEEKLLELLPKLNLPANLPRLLSDLAASGWSVVITSAGCRWYIERVLKLAGVTIPIYANDGGPEAGRLIMQAPVGEWYFSPQSGVEKAAVVKALQADGCTVAYAGDGSSDIPPALAVPENLRFARAFLADTFTRRGVGYKPFRHWAEIAQTLINS